MKKLGFVLLLMLAVISLMVAGCNGDGDGDATPAATATPEATATVETSETATPEATATAAPEETATPEAPDTGDNNELMEILSQAEDRGPVKYDVVMSGGGIPPTTMSVWEKDGKVRTEMTEQGQTMIILTDTNEQIMYMYMPAENSAIAMDYSEAEESVTEQAEDLMDFNPTIIGTEILDGKTCLVVAYDAGEDETGDAKMWIWKEYGFPIRVEITGIEGAVMVMVIENIEFTDISDDMFELPAGVDIIEMFDMMDMMP